MQDESGPPDTTEEWLVRLRATLEAVQKTIKPLDENCRPTALQFIMPEVLRDVRGGSWVGQQVAGTETATPASAVSGTGRFVRFLADNSISVDVVANVVDLESGQILAGKLATGRAESTRRIAALLCLVNARRTGEFIVDRDPLAKACEEHSVYDRTNFATSMDFTHNGSKVFLRDDTTGAYKVSRPGEAYVAFVVKELAALRESIQTRLPVAAPAGGQ